MLTSAESHGGDTQEITRHNGFHTPLWSTTLTPCTNREMRGQWYWAPQVFSLAFFFFGLVFRWLTQARFPGLQGILGDEEGLWKTDEDFGPANGHKNSILYSIHPRVWLVISSVMFQQSYFHLTILTLTNVILIWFTWSVGLKKYNLFF